LAIKAGVPVVPVAIKGTENILGRRRLMPGLFKTATITFLEPVDPSAFGRNRQELSEDIRNRIEEKLNS
jgi:1-acyl-sn-glycerol-3-phosphate acyltransferase